MDINTSFQIALIFISLLLVSVLILQARGSGASLFGQAETTFRSRRGVERLLFRSTIFLAVVFVAVAIANVRFTG